MSGELEPETSGSYFEAFPLALSSTASGNPDHACTDESRVTSHDPESREVGTDMTWHDAAKTHKVSKIQTEWNGR